jgi:uncharacterized protein
MLRDPPSKTALAIGVGVLAVVGAACAVLVANGNPPNMGVCGACFLRDAAGSLGIAKGPASVRPEFVGVVVGALLLALVRGTFTARSGSHAGARFALGIFMGIGTLVFLGCPFRMLQRIGGGDANALVGLAGLVPGVLLGLLFESRGYTVGKTSPAPAPVGLAGPACVVLLFGLALAGVLVGPRPFDAGPPLRAPWTLSLSIGLFAGIALSATGFCTISAVRQVVLRPKGMLLGAAAIVVSFGLVSLATGNFHAGFSGQRLAHTDALWNAVPMALVGLCGALAGGCPVRQMVMTGEGNADAFVTTSGILVGTSIAHGLSLVSTDAGPTDGGKWAVATGLAFAILFGAWSTIASRRLGATSTSMRVGAQAQSGS